MGADSRHAESGYKNKLQNDRDWCWWWYLMEHFTQFMKKSGGDYLVSFHKNFNFPQNIYSSLFYQMTKLIEKYTVLKLLEKTIEIT